MIKGWGLHTPTFFGQRGNAFALNRLQSSTDAIVVAVKILKEPQRSRSSRFAHSLGGKHQSGRNKYI